MSIDTPYLNFLFVILLLFFGSNLFAQKKDNSSFKVRTTKKSSTFVVVVGVSDYQNLEIPDLSFAHKDSQNFADFLKSPSWGNLKDSDLKLLVNEETTGEAVATAIDWLYESVEENDQAIIFFSGHGDVERKGRNQLGFLLCWDSGSNIYMSGVTHSLFYLQNMISAISIEKKANIFMIAGPFRSGKLTVHSFNGAQLTAANLAQQYENEVKILSCQPYEFNLEGVQWAEVEALFPFT